MLVQTASVKDAVYTVWIFIQSCMFLELFLFAKKMKVLTKTISYGAGNSKFLKTEIEWISDFGRTTASQHKMILWDSGN